MYDSPGPAAAYEQDAQPVKRPGQVTAALVMTMVGGAVLAVIGVALAGGAASDLMGGFDGDLLRVIGIVDVVWGAACIALALLAWKRNNKARIALFVLAGLYAVVQLYQVIALETPAGSLPIIYVAIAVSLLNTPQARSWFK